MVHPPAVFRGEILPKVSSGQRSRWSQLVVSFGVIIQVMNTKQKRIAGFPHKSQRFDISD
jgi:hypothetical protein